MLTCTIEQDGKKRVEHLLVIDAHSHLGQDVDGATMMNPLAPGVGTFDFFHHPLDTLVRGTENTERFFKFIQSGDADWMNTLKPCGLKL